MSGSQFYVKIQFKCHGKASTVPQLDCRKGSVMEELTHKLFEVL